MKKEINFKAHTPYSPAGDQPQAHVEYFVSYYDYYQPEAYMHSRLSA